MKISVYITIITLSLISPKFFFSSEGNENYKDVVIYWDASRSQKDSDHSKQFEFLDRYFTTYKNAKIKLVIYNTNIIDEKDLVLEGSDWSPLHRLLNSINYDGASNLNVINTRYDQDILLLFTDGKGCLGELSIDLYAPRIITISSTKNPNIRLLHETAFYNRGYYIDLTKDNIEDAISAIKNQKVLPRLKFFDDKIVQPNLITGYVYSNNSGLPNVSITIPGKNITTLSDANGKYVIAADPGDRIFYTHTQKKTSTFVLQDEKTINVELMDANNTLETVFIESKKEKDYEKVLIGDRVVNKNSLGYDVQTITTEDISSDEIDLGESMAGKFSGVQMGNNNDPGQMIIRGFGSFVNSNHPLFIIDGIPLPRSSPNRKQSMDMIDPNNIASITVLKGIAATNRYGSEGNSGVVLVKTKTASSKIVNKPKEKEELKIDYKVFQSTLSLGQDFDSPYKKMLKAYEEKDPYQFYLKQAQANLNNISFFVECAEYFFEKGDQQKGVAVLSNLLEQYAEDTSVLKIMAFIAEHYKAFGIAQETYKRIIKIAPSLSQTYLDLANCYALDKHYSESLKLFKQMLDNKINDVESFEGLRSQIKNDFRDLLKKRNNTWKIGNVDKDLFYSAPQDFRIVIECSHPQTNYEMQYINPDKKYFILSHTPEANQTTMNQELNEGFTSEEFILSQTQKGKWYLNVIIPSKEKVDFKYPQFLRVKIYSNYGKPNENIENFILNLDRIAQSRLFANFTI